MNIPKGKRSVFLLHLLPLLHLCACATIALGRLEWGYMVWVDFPISVVLVGIAWRYGHAFLWFGFVGTAWWYLLSWMIGSVLGGLIAAPRRQ
jgi:hypothetical protein